MQAVVSPHSSLFILVFSLNFADSNELHFEVHSNKVLSMLLGFFVPWFGIVLNSSEQDWFPKRNHFTTSSSYVGLLLTESVTLFC